jgi:glycosyltransferase involved in cell wall biosynthesis
MRILVDGFNLALTKGTGVATYARNLTYCLQGMGHDVAVLYGVSGARTKTPLMREVSFFDHYEGAPQSKGWLRRAASAAFNPLPRTAYPIELSGAVIYRQFASKLPFYDSLWNSPHLYDIAHTRFRLYQRRLTVSSPEATNIAHWTYPIPIKHRTAKNIYTLHDLVPLRLPYTTLDKKGFYYKLLKKIASQADHIVTVSETSKRDIINLLGVEEHKITNTYESVTIPPEYLRITEGLLQEELFGRFGLNYKEYMLYYGSIEPKKNVTRIIEAHLASNIGIPLVVIGAQAWISEREQQLLKTFSLGAGESGRAGQIRDAKLMHFDYVSFGRLITLIRGARAIVFPSLYEGFGLPILEGMLCETPVITSNFGSMSEIADDACLLVDPYNTYDIKGAIIAAAGDKGLCDAKISRGKIVAERYSPQAHQRRLGEAYEKVSRARPR